MTLNIWMIFGAFVFCVSILVAYAIRAGRKAQQKLDEDFQRMGHNQGAYKVYMLAKQYGATDEQAYRATKAFEHHVGMHTVNKMYTL